LAVRPENEATVDFALTEGTTMKRSASHSQEFREVMDIRQASDYLGISPDTLYKYASEAFIPAFKLGNRWRFKKSRLDEWMDRQSGIDVAPESVPVKARQKKPVRSAGRAETRARRAKS
jgi:excisionase family DNA binding protein